MQWEKISVSEHYNLQPDRYTELRGYLARLLSPLREAPRSESVFALNSVRQGCESSARHNFSRSAQL